ncbi:hypothetical protein DFH06DRAFT_1148270 [Mycena polygramma]|nr:hypothetical protein DFH06DRAFT_1148270 [Mycena polygramma]
MEEGPPKSPARRARTPDGTMAKRGQQNESRFWSGHGVQICVVHGAPDSTNPIGDTGCIRHPHPGRCLCLLSQNDASLPTTKIDMMVGRLEGISVSTAYQVIKYSSESSVSRAAMGIAGGRRAQEHGHDERPVVTSTPTSHAMLARTACWGRVCADAHGKTMRASGLAQCAAVQTRRGMGAPCTVCAMSCRLDANRGYTTPRACARVVFAWEGEGERRKKGRERHETGEIRSMDACAP